VTDVYKLELTDVIPHKNAYLLLKYHKDKKCQVKTNASYLIDKIKLVINKKGQIILTSTSLTVMIQYNLFRVEDEHSLDVDSLGNSEYDENDSYHYQDG
jgi:hypothetical protein